MANAHSFIKELADGYDTIVGENGAKLSGGQKQRLAPARVLLKNPKILILDEPTSSIDSESQKAIIDALSEVTKDRTTIIITHQFPILLLVKYIYVFEKGQIVEQGTHESLLRNNKWYYKLWNNQYNANIGKPGAELPSFHSKLLAAE
nr:ATP-binding cassette domain-containing protein [Pseudoclostridium thermosuccinogenes]